MHEIAANSIISMKIQIDSAKPQKIIALPVRKVIRHLHSHNMQVQKEEGFGELFSASSKPTLSLSHLGS